MARATILVVEDSFAVAKRLQLSLKRAGFAVDSARNGREALAKTRRRQFDFVVTDESMPVMSGREFCGELREDVRYADTPIIFLTADPEALDEVELSNNLDVLAVFEKPFHPDSIVRLIENQLFANRTG